MVKMFVYGTLLSGQGNNRFLTGSNLLGESSVKGFNMVSLGAFPACIPSDGDGVVFGEVWEVDKDTLSNIDRLEGHPHFYHREVVQTDFGDAYMYIQDGRDKGDPIPGGSWLAYRRDR